MLPAVPLSCLPMSIHSFQMATRDAPRLNEGLRDSESVKGHANVFVAPDDDGEVFRFGRPAEFRNLHWTGATILFLKMIFAV